MSFFGMFTGAAAVEESSTLSSFLTILVAIIIGFIALKILKNFAKSIFITAVVIAVVLLVTGVIDFSMIKSAGYGLWDKLLNTDTYKAIHDGVQSLPHIR